MSTTTPSLPSLDARASAEAAEADQLWAATIIGRPDAGLLSRVLQRTLVQGVAIERLCYEADEPAADARIEILFRAEPARAELLVRRWETLVDVQRASLCPARVLRTRARCAA